MIYTTQLLRHLRKTIGINIRVRRAQSHMTLQKLARRSGITEDMLDRYELGKNEIPLCGLLKIACALDIGVAELIDRDKIHPA